MKRNEAVNNYGALLSNLTHLPRKIVSLEGVANTPEFVLYELCAKDCFNLNKAAFFVDNPDFDHIKGIAGYDAAVPFVGSDSIWADPQAFSFHMDSVPFNQKVRNFSASSMKKEGEIQPSQYESIAKHLDIKNPACHSWEMKHDNIGVLIYEYNGITLEGMEEHLNNSLYLLSFCPIF